MEVLVNTQISLLMETVDLVCAYVNGIAPALLTSDKPYCIPVAEVERIMNTVCAGLDRNDPKVQFYFRGYSNAQYRENAAVISSVASMLVYSGLRTNEQDVARARTLMHQYLLGGDCSYRITSSTRGIAISVCEDYRPLADELETIELPDALRLRLGVALSNYHYHVDQVCDLLEPYALRLLALLEPVMTLMEPRAQQWRDVLSTENGQRTFLARINANTETVQYLEIGLRFFYPTISIGYCEVENGVFYCSAGMGLQPVRDKTRESLTDTEISAIQLLSSIERLRVLKALCGRYMSCSELAKELHMNRGTLFRDLNNLVQAGLVYMVAKSSGRTYTTCTENLKRTVVHMLEFVNSGSN